MVSAIQEKGWIWLCQVKKSGQPVFLMKGQRKFSLYGCGIYAVMDLFVHSTAELKDKIVGNNKDNI